MNDSHPLIIIHNSCLSGYNGLFPCLVNQGSTVVTIIDSHDSLLRSILGDFAIMLNEAVLPYEMPYLVLYEMWFRALISF